MGNALETLLKQLRNGGNGGSNTPVGGGVSNYGKKNDFNSPLLGNLGQQGNNNQGHMNQVLNQFLKSQLGSNNGNTFSNINGLSTPQGFDIVSNNNFGGGLDTSQNYALNSPNINLGGAQGGNQHSLKQGKALDGSKVPANDTHLEEINQLNRKFAGGRFTNNFSFVDLNVLPQEQREALEASARHIKEASEMRQQEAANEGQDEEKADKKGAAGTGGGTGYGAHHGGAGDL